MTRAYAEAPATHFRLKPETWAIIAEEYKNGATAKAIGAKWKVAPSSVYRYACRDGFTKKGMGDARARAHARMVEEEEASARSMHPVGSRALKGLFAPASAGNPDAGDPAALARAATLASGRAMTGRLWAEAKALAGLAESYGRIAEREAKAAAARAMTVDTAPLPLIYDILFADQETLRTRFALWGDGPETEHYELRRSWWTRTRQAEEKRAETWRRVQNQVFDLRRQVRELGGEPVEGPM